MDFQLDLATVLLLYNTSLIAGALSIFHIRRHSCRPQGLASLATAYLMLAVGAILAWRGESAALPMWMWTHGSLLLGTGGYALFWAGVRSFSGRRRVPWRAVVLLPLACLAAGIATGFPLQNLLRAGAFHATATLVLAACTFEILRDCRTEPLPSRALMAAFLGLSGSIYALRLAYILGGTAGSTGFAWAFSVQMFCHFGMALMVAALSNERAEIRLEQAAHTDPLTGTGNRRWLESRLPARLAPQSAIAQLDLDRFKQINDRFGHAVGDRVLVEFARCLQGQLRSSDLLARMGGEEFVVYLPAVTQAEAQAIAERLCASVSMLHIEAQGSQISVTVSIGLAWVHDTPVAADTLFKRADDALYQAKQSGRNQVVLAAGTAVQGA
ncbi:diguanylate cyclase (GGDEF) domain-containing protein [Acidovorax sp. CF316]|uniref:GGDEF domain-containing protein n=1 Tax=Acidovorax sp. CF316 TaxID=1144317 RepID=UPI00026BC26A|nr:GGDEF domain-containing protein [Acidovorax sp. CF316]EJE54374.1 diguanylate cyclase (GGDEF) domain-containing protein [Acidovorax sp. CF316]